MAALAKLFSSRRTLVLAAIAAALLVLCGVAIALWCPRALLWAYLVAIVLTAALWFAAGFWLRARARRKQAEFDAAVAAKEGIEDRRREWAQWTEELKRQGIDRDKLPFYLLLGEPQSGKSVLLQNSDLHFPFGQSRLSGVGGTRGCDWWFTDEAVILDLAGRLFTHEGGASDEAEWAAFLELLASFRPMCPANGILLVLPCDGLLRDAPDVVAKKAARMQAALSTLVQKLQVQLPVYVILTKGDKVFGFAETVHRLEAEKRHEMVGWSRAADKLEAPFDLVEARAGFVTLLERCRGLRAAMLASERVPEGLGAIDRLYAFPEELAQAQANLEAYLKQLFTDSAHVERLLFRGFYLTSGLQTGAPIVKACATLLGNDPAGRESDARVLEGLIAKQRAYFIKDLVRRRIFEERGIVRPTRQRTRVARRNAFVGYGVCGVIAITAIAGIANYVPASRADLAGYADTARIAADFMKGDAAESRTLAGVSSILAVLSGSVTRERPWLESALPFGMASSRDEFESAYRAAFEKALPRALRASAEAGLAARWSAWEQARGPYAKLAELVDATLQLQRPLDWRDAAGVQRLSDLAASEPGAAAMLPLAVPEMVKRWLEIAGDDGRAESGPGLTGGAGHSEPLQQSERTALAEIDRALDFRSPCALDGQAGQFAAWAQATEIYREFKDDPLRGGVAAHDRADLFRTLVERITDARLGQAASEKAPTVARGKVTDPLGDLWQRRRNLALGAGKPADRWEVAATAIAAAQKVFKIDCTKDRGAAVGAALAFASDSPNAAELPLPHWAGVDGKSEPAREYLAVCDPALLIGDASRGRAALPRQLREAARTWRAPIASRTPSGCVLLARANELAQEDVAAFPSGDPAAAAASLAPLAIAIGPLDAALPAVVHLIELRSALGDLPPELFAPWKESLHRLLVAALLAADATLAGVIDERPWLDGATLAALDEACEKGAGWSADVATRALATRDSYVGRSLAAMTRRSKEAAYENAVADLPKMVAAATALARSKSATAKEPLEAFDAAAADGLAALRRATMRAWEVDPKEFAAPLPLQTLTEKLKRLIAAPALNERREPILGSALRRTCREPLQTARASPEIKLRFTLLPAAAAQLLDVLDPPEAIALSEAPRLAPLQEIVRALESLQPNDATSRVRFVDSWRKLDPGPAGDAAREVDAAARFAASAVAALDARLAIELREWCVASFAAKFVDEPALVAARRRLLLGFGDPTAGDLEQLSAWLDRGGGLDSLVATFALRSEGRTIRPKADEAIADPLAARAWESLAFCEQLQEFLLAGKATKIAAAKLKARFEVDLQPTSGWQLALAPGPDATKVTSFAIWADRTETKAAYLPINASLRNESSRGDEFAWSCDPGASPGLALLWSESTLPDRTRLTGVAGQEDRIKLYPGSFGLLAACWALGRFDDAAGKWRLEPRFERDAEKRVALHFPFWIAFAPADPTQPALPRLPAYPASLKQRDEAR